MGGRGGGKAGILDDGRFRIFLLGVGFVIAFAALALRLYYLQLHRGEEHRRRIAHQSVRHVRQPGVRGAIYSGDGILLAGNRTTCDLVFYPAEMLRASRGKLVDHMARCAEQLGTLLGRGDFPDAKKIRFHRDHKPGIAMTVFSDLSPRETALAFEALRTMPGADIQPSTVRICPEKTLAAAIVGYARPMDPAIAPDRKNFKYYIPDVVGVNGIEKACDLLPDNATGLGLRAYPGSSIIQVNSLGFVHRELLGRKEPVNGSNVILTLDSRAQRLGEKLLAGSVGAFVVVDADNGDVLCAASSPGFDLSRFYPRLTAKYDRELNEIPDNPRFNRAFNAVYPPGSTLKPLICLAMLRNGVDPDETYDCAGEVTVGDAVIRCSAHRYAGGTMDMETALEKSCNGYMIHHALPLGLAALTPVLREAGIGRRTALELPNAAGHFPDPDRKERRYRTRWNEFDTALLSIGQGFIDVTPLQLALIAGAFANGGIVYRPHLVREIVDVNGLELYRRRTAVAGKLPGTPEQLEIVRRGTFRVVNSDGGPGGRARVEGLAVYGKTGTAEVGSGANRRNITHFIAFVEFARRRYAACVTVEDGLSGGRTCAPLAAAFFEHYLLGD